MTERGDRWGAARWGGRGGGLGVVLLVAVVVAVASGQAAYASSPAPVWGPASQVVLPSGSNGANVPAGDPGVNVNSVSCWSAGNCAAVGTYVVSGSPSNVQVALLLMELNHQWQPSVEGIDPGVGQFELPSVSCVAGGNCVAVGSYRTGNATNDILPDAYTATNGTWSHTGGGVQLPGDMVTPGSQQQVAKLTSVSCVSQGNCVAVGSYTAKQGSSPVMTEGVIVNRSGGTWQAGVPVIPPGNSNANQDTEPSSVSCAPTGACGAVGNYLASSGSIRFALSGTGATLAPGATQLPLPGDASSGGSAIDKPSISCNAGGCAATEPYFQNSRPGTTFALMSRLGSGSWTWVGPLAGPSPYTGSSNVGAISCAATACAAAGVATVGSNGSGGASPVGWDQGASGWTTSGQAIQAPTAPSGQIAPTVLSCASAGNCTTVGVLTTTGSAYYGFGASEVDGTWQRAVNLQMAFGVPSYGPDPWFGSISCPDTGDCTAVGYYQYSGNQQGFVIDATSSSSGGLTSGGGGSSSSGGGSTSGGGGATPSGGQSSFGIPHAGGNSVVVPVTCSGGGSCTLTLTLTAGETLRGTKLLAIAAAKLRHVRVTLGTVTVTISSGSTKLVTVSLNATGRRLLKARGALPLTLTVRQGSVTLKSYRLHLKASVKKHR